MNETDWKAIPCRLNSAGFKVSYERISYEPANPLWRANAKRDGKTWHSLGRDLEAALVALEEQTRDAISDWRTMVSMERARPDLAKSPAMS